MPDLPPPAATPSEHPAQPRVVRTLVMAQVLGGLAVGVTITATSLLAEDVSGSTELAGLAQTAGVLGGAVTSLVGGRVMARHGRRPGMLGAYVTAALGTAICLVAASVEQFWLLLLGSLLFGAGNAAGLQARYAAADLASADRRGHDLSTVVWATTVGVVAGPLLTDPTAELADVLGLPALAGPYALGLPVFLLAAAVVAIGLRPDPLLAARGFTKAGVERARGGLAAAAAVVRASPSATLAAVGLATGHAAMVAVMVMTPLHMRHAGVGLGASGMVISVHVAAMFALSPVAGRLVDAYGPARVLLLAQGLLAAALVSGGPAPGDATALLAVSLFLLGLGWSCGFVAASTLLTTSVAPEDRPTVQGGVDAVMGLAGSGAGALSGVLVGVTGYGGLAVAAAALLVPTTVLALRHLAQGRLDLAA